MNPGKLNTRVIIKQFNNSSDVDGSSDNYRINNVFESEFKYITKITGTKIE